jgi:hypothetical protein
VHEKREEKRECQGLGPEESEETYLGVIKELEVALG